jgi:hypothetical protein
VFGSDKTATIDGDSSVLKHSGECSTVTRSVSVSGFQATKQWTGGAFSPPKVSFLLIFPNPLADKELAGDRCRAVFRCARFVSLLLEPSNGRPVTGNTGVHAVDTAEGGKVPHVDRGED